MELVLNRTTQLALAALEALRHGERMSREELADVIGTSVHFLPQIVRPLVAAGWIRSQRGPSGGYEASQSLDAASLIEIVEAMEGPVGVRCVLNGGQCPGEEACSIHAAWSTVQATLRSEFGNQSIGKGNQQIGAHP